MSVDCDDIVRFQFQDHVDGYVDLDLSEPQETPHTGWTVTPRKEPLRVSIFLNSIIDAHLLRMLRSIHNKKKEFLILCHMEYMYLIIIIIMSHYKIDIFLISQIYLHN